jgi:hypothetical protein
MKILILLIISSCVLSVFSSCQKEYKCTQFITITVNDNEIEQNTNIIYSKEDLTGNCFNYEQIINDTLTKSVTTCQ